ncbi:DUF2207 domain-containing protein [Levilactobacillus tujiorum]|uniref:DUF2207 domain-containing protein n=1 Tax=Levilactobacillus tujiorum TaxID=2912243 RepID=UPI001456B766|nr:DUF2207 domain-containing protein [Levilactobacillus tujiorum]NLR30855.1 DUF2207 domain-containing protein [Levilactobacillus tujiorum]
MVRREYITLMLGFIVGLFGWGIGQPVRASADYTISPYRMAIQVQRDGNADVTQTMTYHFDDDYHGVFNVQDIHGIQGGRLTGVKYQVNHGLIMPGRKSADEMDGDYEVSQNKQRIKVKLYQEISSGDQLKVTYHFRLRGVVTNYRDTAELNWKVIGAGWDEPLKNVRVTIQLPQKPVTKLQAWTHGPLSGQTKVDRQQGKVTMTVDRNLANSFIESHMLFPTTVTATNSNKVDKNHLAAAQKQEAQLARAANRKRQRNRWLRWGGFGLLLALLAGFSFRSWRWYHRHPANRYVHPTPINHSFEVPSVPPALAQSLVDGTSPNANALAGEILVAAANREITLESIKVGRKATVKLTKIGETTNSFLEKCFAEVGSNDSFTLLELKKFGKKDDTGRLNGWFTTWQQPTDEAADAYYDKDNLKLRTRLYGTVMGLSTLIFLTTAASWLLGMTVGKICTVIGVVGLLTFWVLSRRFSRRIDRHNTKGLNQVNELKGFRRMLQDIGHFNTAEIGDLILWEQILPYAAAFGLAQKVADKLAVDFDTADLDTSLVVFYPLFYGSNIGLPLGDALGDSLSTALHASDTSSSSSISGGSGGFSGGSSGGFGGGSGGGAF